MTQSTEDLLAQRKTTHGEYSHHARCTQAIMRALQREQGWEALPDIVKESLHMFAHKMGRVVTGNWAIADHYADIAGYATLIVQRLEDGVGLKEGHRPEDLPGGLRSTDSFSEQVRTNIERNRVGQVECETISTETVRIYEEREEVSTENTMFSSENRANIGHPGELSSRFLCDDDIGKTVFRRDGETGVLHCGNEVGFNVRRPDGAQYCVSQNGFMRDHEHPHAADIRQVLLG